MRLLTIEECERIIPSGEGNRELFLECTRSVTRTGSYLYEPSFLARLTSDPLTLVIVTSVAIAVALAIWYTRQA